MTLREKVLKQFDTGALHFKSYNALISSLSKNLNAEFADISKCLNSLISEGIVVEQGKSLTKAADAKIYAGKLIGNSKGYAFIKSTKNEFEDYFVPAKNLNGALDGDFVQFKVEKGDVAQVIKILERKNQRLTGTVSKSVSKKSKYSKNLFVVADNSKFSKPILINDARNVSEGDKVVVELVFQPQKNDYPVGRVVKKLKNNELEIALENVLCEFQIPKSFSKDTINEAENIKIDLKKELAKRVDLTNETIFTIDGEDAKDLDDAISIKKHEDGYELGVHIADVGNFVVRDSLLDKEAYLRATSVYFPEGVYPMLPKKLSNDLCSLNANEPKLALSVVMTLDNNGSVIDYRIFESVIKSVQRLTYTEVFALFNGEKNNILPQVCDSLLLMKKLSDTINNARLAAGALDFDVPESEFVFENNKVVDVKQRERNAAHKLIENFMVLCNQVVAKCFCELDVPFVYRVHNAPIKTKFDEVLKVVESLGAKVKFTKNITPKYVQNLLNSIKDEDYYAIASRLILRGMEKAVYLPDCDGHFGLALDFYCHFTSPIRRYPDLTIHRIIKEILNFANSRIISSKDKNKLKNKIHLKNIYDLEEFVYDSSNRSSERERNADEAERKVDDIYKACLMKDKISQVFDGKVSGVTNFGIFVELENSVEGIIKLENLPEDDYDYDEKKMTLKGKKRKFSLGDKICVKLVQVDIIQGKIEFALASGGDKWKL